MDIMSKFMQAELNSQEALDEIQLFIESNGIRSGEFEGNEYIIKKMDRDNFIIFPEYIDNKANREIPFAMSIYKEQLLQKISSYTLEKSIINKK